MAKRRRRKMTAKQLKFFGPRRRKRGVKRARARARARRSAKVVVLSTNPAGGSKVARRRRRKHRRHAVARRRFRRNPIDAGGFLSNTIIPAAIGAGGAIAADYLAGMLPIPAQFQTPSLAPVTKIGLSLLVGWGVGAIAGNKIGAEAAAGGIILTLYNFAQQNLLQGGMFGPGSYVGGGQYAGYGPMNRYTGVGFRRRNVVGVNPLSTKPGLGGGPYSQTKYRMMRNGTAHGSAQSGIGYVGPARTLARYAQG